AIISTAASSLRSASVPTRPRKVSRVPKAFTMPLVPVAFAASASRESVESRDSSKSVSAVHGKSKASLQVTQQPTASLEEHEALQTHGEDEDGWMLVTRRRPRRKTVPPTIPTPFREKKQKKEKKQRKRKGRKRSKGKKKGKPTNKFQNLPVDLLEQKRREPVTLEEFFPKTYFHEVSVNTITCTLAEEEKSQEEKKQVNEKGLSHKAEPDRDAKILALLDIVPSCMGWRNALSLPEETRYALARVIENPTHYTTKEDIEQGIYENHPDDCAACKAACSATLAFTDDDLVLGSKPHNRPLFVTGYIRKQRVNRILMDGGSVVNIMQKSTMTELGITADELNQSRLMIQGFNLGGQRAIGMIRVSLTIGEMTSTTIFHVIDAKTSYKLLLGRPWMHENGVVASTLHQCLKYYRNGVQKVIADVKPFGKAESYFADAKFYVDEKEPLEVMPIEVPSTGKVQFHAPKAVKEEAPVTKDWESGISNISSKKYVNNGP
ncbi:Exodeoxyribonuclease I, partial [Bienertia sinuspersici]